MISIRNWQKSDEKRIFELFKEGEMVQHSENNLIRDAALKFIEWSYENDLSHVPETYFNRDSCPHGNYWIAVDASLDFVCGMVALEYKNDQEAELRRMFVDRKYQCKSIGSQLIQTLIEFAKIEGYSSVYLTTPFINTRGIKFYERHNFQVTNELYSGPDNLVHLVKMTLQLY